MTVMEYLFESRVVARVEPAQPEPMFSISFRAVAILLSRKKKKGRIGGGEVYFCVEVLR
jgi:hypothetical protein